MSLSSVVPLHSNPIIKIIFLALHLFLPFLPSPSAILFCVFTVTLCQFSFAFYLMLLFFNAFHPFFSFIFLFVFHLWPWFTQYLCNISSCFQTLCSFANWIYSCRPLRHVLCTDVLGRRQTKIWIKRIETNKKRFRRLFSPWLICQKISHGTFTLSIFFRPPPHGTRIVMAVHLLSSPLMFFSFSVIFFYFLFFCFLFTYIEDVWVVWWIAAWNKKSDNGVRIPLGFVTFTYMHIPLDKV